MPGTLRLNRDGFGIELRRGNFDVVVDGKNQGTIKWHEAVEIPVEAGHHTLKLKAGRYTSRDHEFDVAADEVANLRCHGANIWPVYFASIVKPDLAISIRNENG
jgi:hypothetical protein